MVKKYIRKAKEKAGIATAEAPKAPEIVSDETLQKEVDKIQPHNTPAPVWIRVFFTDGRIFRVPYQALKVEVEKTFGYIANQASVDYVLQDCGKLPWSAFKNVAIQIMRENLGKDDEEWTIARKIVEL